MVRISERMIWVTVFSIAMAFLEAAVVVYLRTIYYPQGFQFPLMPIEARIAVTEIFREAATVVMLIGLGALAGRNLSEKLAYFIFSFAVWDIFYYVFLKLLLDWPDSWFTWDILFLIPVMWVGPVITPLILSVTMILLSSSMIFFNHKFGDAAISREEWILLILGSVIVIISFTLDYSQYMLNRYSISELIRLASSKEIFSARIDYVPANFDWWIFWVGEVLLLWAIGSFIRRLA